MPDNGYLIYRRHNDGQFIVYIIRGQKIRFNNRFIIFYNLYLIRKYNTYINVEICIIIKVIKYIYKYIYKRSDKTTVEI